MRVVLAVLTLVIASLLSALVTHAQYVPSENTCADTDSPDYRPIYPIYEYRNRRLVLKDTVTNADVQEVEINLALPQLSVGWLPQCRYLIGYIGPNYVIWDTTNNTRALEFEARTTGNANLIFDPHGEYIIEPVFLDGTYLWHISTGTRLRLTDSPCGFQRAAYWDYERQQVMGIHTWGLAGGGWCSYDPTDDAVEAFSLQTGEMLARYENPSTNFGVNFGVIADGGKVWVTSQRGICLPAITIYERDTALGVRAATNYPCKDILFTPDYHYMVISGYGKVRIWNIENPDAALSPRDPLYRLDTTLDSSAVIVAPTVVEFTSREGVRRFDVALGDFVP